MKEVVACILIDLEYAIFTHFQYLAWKTRKEKPRVHATFQFTGDCPGFYLAETLDPMKEEFKEYSKIIYDYNMASNRTNREGSGSVSLQLGFSYFH